MHDAPQLLPDPGIYNFNSPLIVNRDNNRIIKLKNMINEAFDFLKENNEVAFATVSENRPSIRIFQIMKIEGTTLYFAT